MPNVRKMLQILQMRQVFCDGNIVSVGGSSLRLSEQRALKRTLKTAKLAAVAAMPKVGFVPDLPCHSRC
jgi:hypothetical protein